MNDIHIKKEGGGEQAHVIPPAIRQLAAGADPTVHLRRLESQINKLSWRQRLSPQQSTQELGVRLEHHPMSHTTQEGDNTKHMRSQDDIRAAKEELATTLEDMKTIMSTLGPADDISILLAVTMACRITLEWVLEEGKTSQRFDELIQKLKHNTELQCKATSGFTGDVN